MKNYSVELHTSDNEEVITRSFELYKVLMDAQITKLGIQPVALELYVGRNGWPIVEAVGRVFTSHALKGPGSQRLRMENDSIRVSFSQKLDCKLMERFCNEFISHCDNVERSLRYLVIAQFTVLCTFYEDDRLPLEERTSLLYAIIKQNKLVTEIWDKSTAIDKQGIIACGATPWNAMAIFDKVRAINNEWRERNLDVAPYFLYKLD